MQMSNLLQFKLKLKLLNSAKYSINANECTLIANQFSNLDTNA